MPAFYDSAEMAEEKDLYKVLQIPRNASFGDIKKVSCVNQAGGEWCLVSLSLSLQAHHRLARQYHPDREGGNDEKVRDDFVKGGREGGENGGSSGIKCSKENRPICSTYVHPPPPLSLNRVLSVQRRADGLRDIV